MVWLFCVHVVFWFVFSTCLLFCLCFVWHVGSHVSLCGVGPRTQGLGGIDHILSYQPQLSDDASPKRPWLRPNPGTASDTSGEESQALSCFPCQAATMCGKDRHPLGFCEFSSTKHTDRHILIDFIVAISEVHSAPP